MADSSTAVSVQVLTLAGAELGVFSLEPDSTVRDLKARIAQKGGPVCLLSLCQGSRVLPALATCRELGWCEESAPVVLSLAYLSPDLDKCTAFVEGGDVNPEELEKLCASCRAIFRREPMLLELEGPLTVVGNIHGHLEQLQGVFGSCGSPDAENAPYLFLGGYVDKGTHSLEVVSMLFVHKVRHPESVFLLRSNHEDAQMSRIYGFYDQCKKKAHIKVWKVYIEVFNHMPVCALVNQKILCVHGGISPHLRSLDLIRALPKPSAIPEEGLLCDLVWSDPAEGSGWMENDRGISCTFGADVMKQCMEDLGVEFICRSHQVVEGVEFFGDGKLATLWSVKQFKGMDTPGVGMVMIVSETGERRFEPVR